MDSSEHDEAMEMPTNPSEDPEGTREIDLADEEGFPANPPRVPDDEAVEGVSDGPSWPEDTPPEDRAEMERIAAENLANADAIVAAQAQRLAEPGIYYCDHESPGEHPVLGLIQPGENDYSDVTDARQLEAIAACCDSGLLRKT